MIILEKHTSSRSYGKLTLDDFFELIKEWRSKDNSLDSILAKPTIYIEEQGGFKQTGISLYLYEGKIPNHLVPEEFETKR